MAQRTGLGFRTSKRLAELMGGEFGVEIQSENKSAVWCSVRLKKASARGIDLPTPRTDLRGVAALAVVGDETAYKNLVAQTLSWGMSCDIALGAAHVLEILRAAAVRGRCYDLAILDMQKPGEDALALARAIRVDPALSAVRPVLLVAVGLRGHAEESRRAGVAGYLTKPVDQSELFNCLTTLMSAQGACTEAGDQPSPQLITSHNLNEAKAHRRTQVLVAEDNTVNQMVAVRMLEKLGAQADVAPNGVQAVEACKRTRYDLVMMDCQMPEMDGFEATRAILELERIRGGAHTPIVAVTANAMQGDREKCLAAGMDDYVSKPCKLDQIRELLSRWIPHSPPLADAMEAAAALNAKKAVPNTESSVDASVLNSFRARAEDGLPDFLTGLKGQFLSEARSRMTAIDEAVGRADASALKQAAHASRGSSSVVGASTLAAICLELENRARDGLENGVDVLVAQLESEFGRVQRELNVPASR